MFPPKVLMMDMSNVLYMSMMLSTAVAMTTLLPEMEDASLDPWEHGGMEESTEELTTSV